MPILHVPLDRQLDQALERLARAEDRTPAQQVRFILRRALALPDCPSDEQPAERQGVAPCSSK